MSTGDATIRLGIENGRAKYAFEEVEKFVKQGEGTNAYRSYVKKLPSMIQVNGLGQTLAFCYAKGDQYKEIYKQIEGWIRYKRPELLKRYSDDPPKEFIHIVVSMNSNDYRMISNEVLALLDWMRRFADGMIRDLAKD